MTAPRARGEGSIFLRGRVWWIAYSVRGRRVQESSKSADQRVAVRLLRDRLGTLAAGHYTGPKAESVTFEDLIRLLETDYAVQQRRSPARMRQAVARLAEHFSGMRALSITADALKSYMAARQRTAARATAAYELAILKRAFRVAVDLEALPRAPKFPSLKVENARQGFFEAADLEALCRELPPHLVPVARFAFLTGWRREEIVGLTWERVDFTAGVVRLDVRTTKNAEGRTFPMDALPALAELMAAQRRACDVWEALEGRRIAEVFTRKGKPLRDFYGAWRAACARAGIPGRFLHDFRRTAVRNLERAGVSRSVAMKLTGHKTEAVYRRYAIVNETDLKEGVAKLAKSATELQQSEGLR